MSRELTDSLMALARDLGASAVGVASAQPFARELDVIRENLADGRSGPLHFTYNDPELATDVVRSFPWAQTLLVVSWNYLAATSAPSEKGALVARFAVTDQYQELETITTALARRLSVMGFRTGVLIDDNRLVDRAAATRSGVGWRGKSTMILAPRHGPWTLLGSVVTDAPLVLTPPMRRDCGKCVACYPACPTGALSDRGLDARRCIATWLQTKGCIPHWVRPLVGRRIYGCDECLTACPPGNQALREAAIEAVAFPFEELLSQSDDELLERFSWWYVPRRRGIVLRRNLLIAAGNAGEPESRDQLATHLEHTSPMIRGIAAWAFARAVGTEALPLIESRLNSEKTAEALRELSLARLMVTDPIAYRDLVALEESNTVGPAWRNPDPGVGPSGRTATVIRPKRAG